MSPDLPGAQLLHVLDSVQLKKPLCENQKSIPLPDVWPQLKLRAVMGTGACRRGLLDASTRVSSVKTHVGHLQFIHFSLCILQKVPSNGKHVCIAIYSFWNGTFEWLSKRTSIVPLKVGLWLDAVKIKTFFKDLCRKIEVYCNNCVSHTGPWLSVLKHKRFEQINVSSTMIARFYIVKEEQNRVSTRIKEPGSVGLECKL